MTYGIRPSTTRSTAALWAKSLLNAILFFAIFMAGGPYLAYRLLPLPLPVPHLVRVVGGWALVVTGSTLWSLCLDSFSRRGRGTPFALDAPRELVTSGPFAVVRNPIILAELSVIWGEALYFAAAGIAVYAALVTLAAHVVVTRIEEPELRERFGAAYDAFCQRVPRWVPKRRSDGRRRTRAGS